MPDLFFFLSPFSLLGSIFLRQGMEIGMVLLSFQACMESMEIRCDLFFFPLFLSRISFAR